MPIIDVEIVAESADAELTQRLADGLGQAFKAAPGKVWVRVRLLAPGLYAENQEPNPPAPVFVTILSSRPPEGDALDRRVSFVTDAVARATGRDPRYVHVLFEATTRGRLAFGGQVVL